MNPGFPGLNIPDTLPEHIKLALDMSDLVQLAEEYEVMEASIAASEAGPSQPRKKRREINREREKGYFPLISSRLTTASLTIFYNGTISAFDVTPNQAENIMKLAKSVKSVSETTVVQPAVPAVKAESNQNPAIGGVLSKDSLPLSRHIGPFSDYSPILSQELSGGLHI
ncbi:hypothetical protein SSX86_007905 [Deinandra increscens subsp. villosa]|uniref:Tify domain-containing protein n=1 Tax=Deinandra increscens subsp. villosa TaxID=3103831 RepID=A0AAP0DFJ7_9ASTR